MGRRNSEKYDKSDGPKAVITKKETILSSPGHQLHECDVEQAEEATMWQKFVNANIWAVEIWRIHKHLPNSPVPSVQY